MYVRKNEQAFAYVRPLYCGCKIALFNSYCTSLYCSFVWTELKKKSTFSKVRIAFNNTYRRIFGLPKWSSASEMYACNKIDNFETLMRKGIYGFVQRLESCENSVVQSNKVLISLGL